MQATLQSHEQAKAAKSTEESEDELEGEIDDEEEPVKKQQQQQQQFKDKKEAMGAFKELLGEKSVPSAYPQPVVLPQQNILQDETFSTGLKVERLIEEVHASQTLNEEFKDGPSKKLHLETTVHKKRSLKDNDGSYDRVKRLKIKDRADSGSSTQSNAYQRQSNPSAPTIGVSGLTIPNFIVPPTVHLSGHSDSSESAASTNSDESDHLPSGANREVDQPERSSSENSNVSDNAPQTETNSTTSSLTDSQTKSSIINKNKLLIEGTFEVLHTTDDEEPTFTVRNVKTGEYGLCREITMIKYRKYMQLYERFFNEGCDEDEHVLQRAWPDKTELFMTKDGKCYHVLPRHYGTLHSYVIDKKKLSEEQTRAFYRQIVETVAYCHDRGVVVRDVKLRKFVFVDEQRTSLRFDDLDEFFVCPSVDEDTMIDRHGCPAYASPEILDLSSKMYAGRPADIWGLGVLLYVLLIGRYPFYDTTPTGLFRKIRSVEFLLNEQCLVSSDIRWLIRSLLRKSPDERPKAREILAHAWLSRAEGDNNHVSTSVTQQDLSKNSSTDQFVPGFESISVLNNSTDLSLASLDQSLPQDCQESFFDVS